MQLKRRPAPLLFRGFNEFCQALRWDVVSLDPEEICEKATWSAGSSDFGHSGFRRRFFRMMEGARKNPRLTTTGRIAQRIFYHWHVTNRLLEVDALRVRPEIKHIPFVAPIIVVGGYRTGTTHLHNLLSQDPRLRTPKTWEVSFQTDHEQDRRQDAARRRRNTHVIKAMNMSLIPDQADAHELIVDGAEECHFMLENSALSMTQYISFQGYDYAQWLLTEDVTDAYEQLRAQYQLLAWRDREESPDQEPRTWVLKCPLHTWHLEALMRVFPDARLLFTHRPMTSTLASTCSLTAITASKFFHSLDGEDVGRFWTDYYEKGLSSALSAREAHPEWKILDVHLRDLAASPLETVERIYSFLDRELSAEARQRMSAYVNLPKGVQKNGPDRHRYSPSEFGLSEPEVNERFFGYQSRFDVLSQR